jgi:hypothetical protein
VDQDEFLRRQLHHQPAGDLDVVLRAHLWVEGELDAIISAALRKPEFLPLERMTFALKRDVARATGFVPDELHHAIAVLNKARNDLAHGPASLELSDRRLQELSETVPFADEIRSDVEPTAGMAPRDWALRTACAALALGLREHREQVEKWAAAKHIIDEAVMEAARQAEPGSVKG